MQVTWSLSNFVHLIFQIKRKKEREIDLFLFFLSRHLVAEIFLVSFLRWRIISLAKFELALLFQSLPFFFFSFWHFGI